MGVSSQGTVNPIRSYGRGFTVVDPERQREIDLEQARMIRVRRSEGPRSCPPAIAAWLSAQRDAADEGGSVRRSR